MKISSPYAEGKGIRRLFAMNLICRRQDHSIVCLRHRNLLAFGCPRQIKSYEGKFTIPCLLCRRRLNPCLCLRHKAFEIFLFDLPSVWFDLPKARRFHTMPKAKVKAKVMQAFACKPKARAFEIFLFVCDDLPKARRFHTTLAYLYFIPKANHSKGILIPCYA